MILVITNIVKFSITEQKWEKKGSLQEVTVNNFFGEANPETSFRHQNGIKKKAKKKER